MSLFRCSLTFALISFSFSVQADPRVTGLINELKSALPAKGSAYEGRNNGRPCAVSVEYYQQHDLYIVTVSQETKAGQKQKMSFAMNPKSRVTSDSFVGRKSEFIEASVNVQTGRIIEFEQIYGSFSELTMGLEIRKTSKSKSPSARKIWVTNTRAGKIGGSGPACIIEIR